MLGFIIGFLLGGTIGMFLTASVTVASNYDDREDEIHEQKSDKIPSEV